MYLEQELRLGQPVGTYPEDGQCAGDMQENVPPRAEGTWPGPASHFPQDLPPRCLACSQHFTPFSGRVGGVQVQVTAVSQLDRPFLGHRASGAEGQGPPRDQAPGPCPLRSAPPQGGEGDANLRSRLGMEGSPRCMWKDPHPSQGQFPPGLRAKGPLTLRAVVSGCRIAEGPQGKTLLPADAAANQTCGLLSTSPQTCSSCLFLHFSQRLSS